MPPPRRKAIARLAPPLVAALLSIALAACGTKTRDAPTATPSTTAASTSTTASTATSTAALPGTGKPQVTIGDKNFTEQFVLGSLYQEALTAQGFTVVLNRNIGPTEVTIQALESGTLDMYPEYLETWNSVVARYRRLFRTLRGAYRAGQRYALAQGLELLNPTPFSDTDAIGVTQAYGAENDLNALGDLRTVAATLTFGAPLQFQQDPNGLPAIEQAYGFVPSAFKALDVGAQYQALDRGSVQAADVNTTDGQLASGSYKLLRDPQRVFGWGNVVPVVSAKVMLAEGPVFAATIDRVSGLLTTTVMRRLNAAVDISHQDPSVVAKQFLRAHGLLPATTP
jgi:osmoprotectant transport system substrate-binding protein